MSNNPPEVKRSFVKKLLAYLTVCGFSVGVGPSEDAVIPNADRVQYGQTKPAPPSASPEGSNKTEDWMAQDKMETLKFNHDRS